MVAFRKRKRYVVKSYFQFKYTAIILLFVFLTVFLAATMTYVTVFPYLSEKLANVYPQSRLITILTKANIRVIYASALLIPLAIWIGVFLSHKIAGPWHRLETILSDMADGNIADFVKLRKGDELISLSEALNRVIARLKSDKGKVRQEADILQQDILKLQEELTKPQPDFQAAAQLAGKLKSSTEKLKSLIT